VCTCLHLCVYVHALVSKCLVVRVCVHVFVYRSVSACVHVSSVHGVVLVRYGSRNVHFTCTLNVLFVQFVLTLRSFLRSNLRPLGHESNDIPTMTSIFGYVKARLIDLKTILI
jgi:hypothetical protein